MTDTTTANSEPGQPFGLALTDLLGRLEAHACMHDDLVMHDPEQKQWAADLRAAKAEIERLRGIVPDVLERLNDDLCAENNLLRDALQGLLDAHARNVLFGGGSHWDAARKVLEA